MKYYVIFLLALGLTNISYSQDIKDTDSKNGNISMENLPAVVIKSAGTDFSVYLPDRNADPKVRKLEDSFIAYDLGKNYEGFETYLVFMEIKGGSLSATYNENGKLLSVVENYKNVKLPGDVVFSIYKKFPGWEIVNDKYLYTQKEGDVLKKQYNLKIKKGKETKKLTVHPDGEIIAGL
ncbi:phage tail protein [Flavobacterium degerlachei]|jgi:hypothetical protein|uniref:Nicotinic acid mononucleotide adenyltransferase n=1 Tax=Flavobacterium degerlachei TaxID=229203 RepID=A0A1H2X0V1_9FLAO|nr:hypothetical protein [Flavobacterium degerlachei]SDW86437.1 hypothetical protein SAMN05444338_105112 [Flavobacterium degerlachei]